MTYAANRSFTYSERTYLWRVMRNTFLFLKISSQNKNRPGIL